MTKQITQDSSDFKIYWRLLKYIRPYILMFIISILGYLIFASVQPLLAQILKYFVDSLNGTHAILFPSIPYINDLGLVYLVPLLLIVIALWQGLGTFLGDYYIARVTLGIVQDVRIDLFKQISKLPCEYFDEHNSSEILSLLLYNVNMITGAATDAIKVVFREGFTVIFLFGYLFYMNWKLTLVMVFALPVIAIIVSIASKRIRKQSRKSQESMASLIHASSEYIKNYRAIRVYGGNFYEKNRFSHVIQDSKRKMLRLEATSNAYTPILQLVMYTAMAVLLFLVLLLKGQSSVGDLVAYITAAGLLPKPMRQLSEVSETIQKGLAGAESIFNLLDYPVEIDNGAIEKEKVNGKLDVRNLEFTYPNTTKKVLKNISFSADSGQMVALVGKSGSGKSTLASLLLRFYHHHNGDILLDNVELNDYKLSNLRKHVALVTQQVTLFNDTIFKNIAYGELSNATKEQVKEAARLAYADEFIQELPDGYETIIGENGVKLSGGQRQRLAIARAFLKNAPLLILDEATSALDNESERYIQAALDRITEGRTTLVIAHRLSTIEKADKILVMSDGEIVEIGNHKELLAKEGVYAKLYVSDEILIDNKDS